MSSSAEAAHNRVPPTLPDWVQAQISDLQSRLAERDSELVKRDAELKRRELKIQQLTLELAHHKRIRFGCKSEALTSEQRDLFVESSDEDGAAIVAELAQQQEPAVTPRAHKRPGRNPLPPELPRIEHRHEPESCTCGQCGKDLVKISEDMNNWTLSRHASSSIATSAPNMPAATAKRSPRRRCPPPSSMADWPPPASMPGY